MQTALNTLIRHLTASLFPVLTAALIFPGCCGAKPAHADNFTVVELKVSSGDLVTLLTAEAAKAQELGRKPFVELYADWCGPCKALRDSLNDPLMAEAFDGTYIVMLDYDDWADTLAGTGYASSSIPVFFEMDAGGKPTGRSINGGAWGENIPVNMAPPLKTFFHE